VFDNACRPGAAASSPRRPAFDPNNSSQFSEKYVRHATPHRNPHVFLRVFTSFDGCSWRRSSVADRSGEDFHRRAMRAVSFPNVVHRSESVADVVGDMDGEGEDDEDDDDEDDEDASHGGDIFQSGLASPHLAQKSPTAKDKDGQSHHVAFGRGGRSASKFSATTSQVDEELLADRYHEEKEMIQRFMADRKMEIFAIVEGIDATTGGPCQVQHIQPACLSFIFLLPSLLMRATCRGVRSFDVSSLVTVLTSSPSSCRAPPGSPFIRHVRGRMGQELRAVRLRRRQRRFRRH